MKILKKLRLPLLLIVAGLLYAADYYDLPWVYPIAIVAFGLIGCLVAFNMILRGEASEEDENTGRIKRYSGLSARLIAMVVLIPSSAFLILGIVDLVRPGRPGILLNQLASSPQGWAIILGLAGSMIIALGLVRILSGSSHRSGIYYGLVEFGVRLGGAIFALAGLAMILLAAGLLVAPDLMGDLFQKTVSLVESWVLKQ